MQEKKVRRKKKRPSGFALPYMAVYILEAVDSLQLSGQANSIEIEAERASPTLGGATGRAGLQVLSKEKCGTMGR